MYYQYVLGNLGNLKRLTLNDYVKRLSKIDISALIVKIAYIYISLRNSPVMTINVNYSEF